jgi:uncharacterized protein (TIGR01615 family)
MWAVLDAIDSLLVHFGLAGDRPKLSEQNRSLRKHASSLRSKTLGLTGDVDTFLNPKNQGGECASTAFWKHLAALYTGTRAKRHVAVDPHQGALEQLGILVDSVVSEVPDASLALLTICYILRLSGEWQVKLCHCSKPTSPFSTSFLLVRPEAATQNFVVDLFFADKFRFARVTPRMDGSETSLPSYCAGSVENFPSSFVGTESTLQRCVEFCSSLIAESFTALAMDLPPWRRNSHLQSVYKQFNEEHVMDILNRVDSSLHLAARGSKPRNPRLGQFALQLLGLLKSSISTTAAAVPSTGLSPEVLAPFVSNAELMAFLEHLTASQCQSCLRTQRADRTITFEKEKVMPVSPAAGPSLLTQWIAVRSPSQQRCGNEARSPDQRLPPMELFPNDSTGVGHNTRAIWLDTER